MGTEFFLADGQTDKHNQANIPFLQFFRKAPNTGNYFKLSNVTDR